MTTNYYLLDNGEVTNFPPTRYQDLSIVAVLSICGSSQVSELYKNNTLTPVIDEALEQMKYKGKKETITGVLELLKNASYRRCSMENPV